MGKLQSELGKKRPFASTSEEALLNLLRTADRVDLAQARLFREHGLTPAQYNILRILRGEGKPMPCLKIAERTITLVPGITGLIDRLERAGLVARQRCENDRRQIFVALTSAAEKLLTTLDEPVRELNDRLLSNLTGKEQAELTRLLEKARENMPGPDQAS